MLRPAPGAGGQLAPVDFSAFTEHAAAARAGANEASRVPDAGLPRMHARPVGACRNRGAGTLCLAEIPAAVNEKASRAERLTVICDLDGTLVDSAPDLSAALDTVLIERGVPTVPFEDIRLLVGDGALVLIERALARVGPPERHDTARMLERFLDVYRSRLTRESRPYPGVHGALRALAGCGHPLAVCTNKPEGLARRMLAELGLDQFGGAVVGGDTFAFRKPDRRMLEAAAKRAGGDPERSVLIGDSRTDVETARNAGVPVILVSYGYRTDPIEDLAADFVVHEFGSVAAAVRQLVDGREAAG